MQQQDSRCVRAEGDRLQRQMESPCEHRRNVPTGSKQGASSDQSLHPARSLHSRDGVTPDRTDPLNPVEAGVDVTCPCQQRAAREHSHRPRRQQGKPWLPYCGHEATKTNACGYCQQNKRRQRVAGNSRITNSCHQRYDRQPK
jgi:hypothetical protein